ncbi:MAG: hypothetical protein HQK57_06410 [Deltaproteobacteria bacterium]|nr:hypothetical protein [Deltaproteobacteria bacterium]
MKSHFIPRALILVLVVSAICATILGMAGCGAGGASSGGGTEPTTGNTIQLTVIPDQINVVTGGSALIQVLVWDPTETDPTKIYKSGVVVNLTASMGTLGAASVTTGSNGAASTTLTPKDTKTIGNGKVTASVGGSYVYVNVEFYKTL